MRLIVLSTIGTIGLWLFAGCEQVDTSRGHAMPTTEARSPESANPSSAPVAAPGESSSTSKVATKEEPAPDNTAVNERDATSATKTAIDQKETQRDVNITADIRKKVLEAEHFSINARNVKIITEDGKVVLRGPVETTAERNTIDTIAREIAGKDNVDNQLEVKEVKEAKP